MLLQKFSIELSTKIADNAESQIRFISNPGSIKKQKTQLWPAKRKSCKSFEIRAEIIVQKPTGSWHFWWPLNLCFTPNWAGTSLVTRYDYVYIFDKMSIWDKMWVYNWSFFNKTVGYNDGRFENPFLIDWRTIVHKRVHSHRCIDAAKVIKAIYR